MAYEIIDPESVDPRPDIPGDHRYIQDVTKLEHLSMQFVRTPPGESFVPYHYHDVQEELFYIILGELHVRTPDTEYVVEPGEVFVAQPGSPLQPYVPETATADVEAIILNAPQADDYQSHDPEN
jgi:uncharacterized cupin superfamily protein